MMFINFIILQVIVFGAVIFIMKKILTNDTQLAVGRMDSVYQDMLKKQKELTEKIEAAEKEYQEKKEEAEKIGEEIKAKATDEGRAKKDEMLKQAKTTADDMLGKAKQGADNHFKKVEQEAMCKVVDTASAILARALTSKTSQELHNVMINDFLEKGEKFDLSRIGPQVETMTIKTAFPLTEEQKSRINALVSSKINRNLKLDEIEEKSVIAGALFQFGTLLLDASLANAVTQAAEQEKTKITQS